MGRVENDAVGVEMGVQSPGGIMGKEGGLEVSCHPICILAVHSNPRAG